MTDRPALSDESNEAALAKALAHQMGYEVGEVRADLRPGGGLVSLAGLYNVEKMAAILTEYIQAAPR